jgi:hypothetical protein
MVRRTTSAWATCALTIALLAGIGSTGRDALRAKAAGRDATAVAPAPYQGIVPALPGTIEAARFDDGGDGVAYNDRSKGNAGKIFRNTNVDITTSSEGGYLVGWTEAGEWLLYSVSVQAGGPYQLQLRVASAGPGGTLHIEIDGTDATGPLTVPDTGGWQRWRTIAAPLALTAGRHLLKVAFDTNGPTNSVGNLSWMKIVGRTPYMGTPAVVPGTIQAERFDDGAAGVAYRDTTSGNEGGMFRTTDVDIQASALGGYNVGWIADGEWLAYTVHVSTPGLHQVAIALAAPGAGSRFRLEAGGVSTPITVPATGGWQSWTTVTASIALGDGPQTLRLVVETGGFNLGPMVWTRAPVTLSDAPPPASVSVGPSDDLQAAIDAARPGDTIMLAPGATYVGNFILPAKSGTGVITIRSSAADAMLPADGVRITPAFAPFLPVLRSPNSLPAVATAPGAHHYRLQFLELAGTPGGYGDVVRFGDGSAAQNTLAGVPHDLEIDRCYVHGDPVVGQKRGLALNSAASTVRHSYFADFKAVGIDSQAIAGWNGPGPYLLLDNYLEAAGEVVMFGGADPAVPNLVPSDITVRRNHLTRPFSWRGQQWQVKNLFELKSAQRVVIDGNVMENHWAQAQPGYAVLFTPRNQDGSAPWTVVQDVQFTNNIVRHVSSGFNILGSDDIHPSQLTSRIVIRNNLFEDVSGSRYGGPGRFMLITGGADVTVDHNTVIQDGWTALYSGERQATSFTFTNNLIPDYSWAVMGVNTSPGNGTIAAYFPGGIFLGGIFAGSAPWQYPAGNYFPTSLSDVGFTDLTGGNYRLAPTSAYKGAGTDGKDVGCLIDAINAAAGVAY